jgi:hypothetical protein
MQSPILRVYLFINIQIWPSKGTKLCLCSIKVLRIFGKDETADRYRTEAPEGKVK